MNIRKRVTIIAALSSLLLISCSEDFLDTTPTSSVTEANFIRNEDELENMLNASYSWLCGNFGLYPPANMTMQYYFFGNIGSDDSEKGGANDRDFWYFQDISLSQQNAGNEMIEAFWVLQYTLIESCNVVIQNAEKLMDNPELDAGRIEEIADQARYLRAFGYYHLLTMYGDVPLRTKIFDPNEPFMERTDQSEVWEQIIEDLTEASDLPQKSESQFGRVTRGAVYSLLGKVYMWLEEYGKAAEAYTTIIESGEYSLVPDFGLIHRWDGENCDESIFEFQSAVHVDGGNVATCAPIFRLPRFAPGGGFGFDNPSLDLVNEFEEGDPRLLYTVIFEGDVFPTPEGDYVVENVCPYSGYYCRKAWVPLEDHVRGGGDWYNNIDHNLRFSRYAEVLLFCAEALTHTGETTRALEYVNMIRKRARETKKVDQERVSTVWDSTYTGEILLPDITATDPVELRHAIWHEQRVELAMEGHRRWVLLRTGRFKERMEAAKGDKGCMVEDHEWLLPIPIGEIESTKGVITQNPGYQ